MSMTDYESASEIIQRYAKKAAFLGPRPEELVTFAEQRLGMSFPHTYRRFLRDYGAGSFGGTEIYGVIHDEFDESSVPDAIWYTLTLRKQASLPDPLVVISDLGDGEVFCLEISPENVEAPVITFQPGYTVTEQRREEIADDFGSFLLQIVRREIGQDPSDRH